MSPAPTRFGLTWWGQRWIAALEALGAAYANRLPRGRTYARKQTVTQLAVASGQVTARVKGSRPAPYRVRLALPVFSDDEWQAATAALAGELRHAAALLDGRMPEDVDEVLAGCGLSLFPGPGELATSCSCPDWANPCKHVAAVHYVLAQTFDADPFLLPLLRGRDQDALLAGLRGVRSGQRAPTQDEPDDDELLPLSALSAAGLFASPGGLDDVVAHPHEPGDPGAVLRRLGPPPSLPAEALERLVSAAAERAWLLASGEDGDDADPELLDTVREHAPATSADLAAALGQPVEVVRWRLRPLLEAGLIHRTGHARSTRYHA
ncbi:MAG: winged helix-turn-helix transcriptional regulator [Euzebyales bacterium]|nr:winged helix-turn-helix transcriptional regulator [Euzebyales bacterium]